MKKLTYDEVKNIYKDNGCELLSKFYLNNKKKLKFIAKCGHEDICSLDCFKKRDTKQCISCVNACFLFGILNVNQ